MTAAVAATGEFVDAQVDPLILDEEEEEDEENAPLGSGGNTAGAAGTSDRFAILDDLMAENSDQDDFDDDDDYSSRQRRPRSPNPKHSKPKARSKTKQGSTSGHSRRPTKRELLAQEASYANWLRNRNISLPVAKPKSVDIAHFYNSLNKKARAYSRYEKVAAEGAIPLQVPDIIIPASHSAAVDNDDGSRRGAGRDGGASTTRQMAFGGDMVTLRVDRGRGRRTADGEDHVDDYDEDDYVGGDSQGEVRLVIVQTMTEQQGQDMVGQLGQSGRNSRSLRSSSVVSSGIEEEREDGEALGMNGDGNDDSGDDGNDDIDPLLDEDLLLTTASQVFPPDTQLQEQQQQQQQQQQKYQDEEEEEEGSLLCTTGSEGPAVDCSDVNHNNNDNDDSGLGEDGDGQQHDEQDQEEAVEGIASLDAHSEDGPHGTEIPSVDTLQPLPTFCGLSQAIETEQAPDVTLTAEVELEQSLPSPASQQTKGSPPLSSVEGSDSDDDDYDPERTAEDCEEVLSDYWSEDEADLDEDSEAIAAEEELLRMEMEGFIVPSDDEYNDGDTYNRHNEKNFDGVELLSHRAGSVSGMSIASTRSMRSSASHQRSSSSKMSAQQQQWDKIMRRKSAVQGQMVVKGRMSSRSLALLSMSIGQSQKVPEEGSMLDLDEPHSLHSMGNLSQTGASLSQISSQNLDDGLGVEIDDDDDGSDSDEEDMLMNTQILLRKARRRLASSRAQRERQRRGRRRIREELASRVEENDDESNETDDVDGSGPVRKRLRRVIVEGNIANGNMLPVGDSTAQATPNTHHSCTSTTSAADATSTTDFVTYIERQASDELFDEIMANSAGFRQSNGSNDDVMATTTRRPSKKSLLHRQRSLRNDK